MTFSGLLSSASLVMGPVRGHSCFAAVVIRIQRYCHVVRRVLFDSNALDPVLRRRGAYEVLEQAVSAAELEVFFTHITIDEIAATPELEKRQWLLNLLVFLGRPGQLQQDVGLATCCQRDWCAGPSLP